MLKTRAGDTIGNDGGVQQKFRRGETPAVRAPPTVQRIYRRGEMQAVTGYCIDHLYDLIRLKKFPAPVPLGPRAVGWLESDISEWQRQRIAARDAA